MSEVSIEEQISELQAYKAEQQTLVDARDQAIRLSNHSDFKKLILDGFCLHEAARYAQESGDPMLTASQRADALAIAQASGHLKRFLSLVIMLGNTAANNVIQSDAALSEVASEQVGA